MTEKAVDTPPAPGNRDARAGQPPEQTDDLGYREGEEERAYEQAQPDKQPEVSSEPEPDHEPPDAG